ncbi:probable cytochrome P450 9h1 [Drosophila albomicans]|uniref:Probable cytochrome P450 9h1 n=1 Tax=Drosophila albomicans TaxID=7291 RepID=A0A6P8WVV2_DROAB|nr:probable cytochrome P450 9h1 [Drosophila albomicans]
MYLIIGTLVIVLLALIYKWSVAKYQTFIERGIRHETPKPLMGNFGLGDFLGSVPQLQKQIDQHREYRDCKVYGLYFLRDPIFVVRDVELIKNVGVKDFDHFMNHSGSDKIESLLTKSLVQLKDRKWKNMRNILTPTFTGKKMRAMYELINVCSELGVKYIAGEIKEKGADSIELEMKDYFTRFTNDVIASAAFGIKVDSFAEKENEFFKIGQSVTKLTATAIIKGLLFSVIPKIMKALRVSVFDEKSIDYFKRLVFDAMKYRKEHEIIRPDMIHLLMEAQRQGEAEGTAEKQFSDDDLLAQCLLFFFAGFETVSTCLCFLTYELCKNPEVQSQLYNEIREVQQKLQGKPLDYDTLVHMKYLDMVVSEALRKWPPAPRTDRLCNADIDLKDENNQFVVSLKKGDVLFIPIIALHYDPENFAEPTEFRPERFSDENKQEIKPFTYLPFGVGPRNCIGNRLALMEVKSIVYHLILKFQLEPAQKTVKDMMSSIQGFTMVPKEKFWIKFVARKSNES